MISVPKAEHLRAADAEHLGHVESSAGGRFESQRANRRRRLCLDDQIGYDLRTNGAGAGAMLFVPTAVGTDRAVRQVTRVVGIVGDEPVDHAAARSGPLLAPALHAGVGKAESLLRCSPLVSQLHEDAPAPETRRKKRSRMQRQRWRCGSSLRPCRCRKAPRCLSWRSREPTISGRLFSSCERRCLAKSEERRMISICPLSRLLCLILWMRHCGSE